MRLLIFDLDGTLTATGEVDAECYMGAWRTVFGIDDVSGNWSDYPQVTDAAVTAELFSRRLGRSADDKDIERLKNALAEQLTTAAAVNPERFSEVPGAAKALDTIAGHEDWCAVVATGAWGVSARIKLERSGLDRAALPLASADDGVSRLDIVRRAERLAVDRYGVENVRDPVLVGDGPWDVETAAALGYGFVGIGNGAAAERMRRAGARLVLEDYRDTDRFLEACHTAPAPG